MCTPTYFNEYNGFTMVYVQNSMVLPWYFIVSVIIGSSLESRL